jgi:hypothetical protein
VCIHPINIIKSQYHLGYFYLRLQIRKARTYWTDLQSGFLFYNELYVIMAFFCQLYLHEGYSHNCAFINIGKVFHFYQSCYIRTKQSTVLI